MNKTKLIQRPWVIKAGGELLSDEGTRKKLIAQLKILSRRHPTVFVHGGGPQIEKELKKNKIPVKFVGGRRVTSRAAMVVVERILSGEINKGFTADLVSYGVPAVGLSCRDAGLVTADPIPGLGRAARPIKVNGRLLRILISNGFLPVISTVGSDQEGAAVNINADDAASAVATDLKARHLIFLTNISGVLDAQKKRIPILKISTITELINQSVIQGGMIPKVQSAKRAIQNGVGEVDILNGGEGIKINGGTRIMK